MPASWSASTGASKRRSRAPRRSLRASASPPRTSGGGLGGGREGPPLRLPHVRRLRSVEDGHVLPDELPESAAQRPVRRRPRERQLRGLSRYALRLGAGLRGKPAHARGASNRRRSAAGQSRAERLFDLDAAGARESQGGAMTAAALPHPHDIGADPAAPLVDLPGHSSRGRLERVLRAENSPSPPSSVRRIRPTSRTSRSGRAILKAGSTASTPPTAPARIAICRASRSARS